MKIVKRWGVMALVALLVLGSMGAALADDGVDTDPVKEPLDPSSEPVEVSWLDDLVDELVTFVFYWGLEGPPECPTTAPGDLGGGLFGFGTVPDTVEVTADCIPLDVEGPNGQVNHGTMVSAFVHWLKAGGMDDLPVVLQEMPKGQVVKKLANHDFGKGFYDFDGDLDGDLAEVAESEEDDGNGPPDFVQEKKADKAAKKDK
jgi:hypothetical protein